MDIKTIMSGEPLTPTRIALLVLATICMISALVALALSWKYFFDMSFSGSWNLTGFLFIFFFIGLVSLGILSFSFCNINWKIIQDSVGIIVALCVSSLFIVTLWGMTASSFRFSIFLLLLSFLVALFFAIKNYLPNFERYKAIAIIFPLISLAALLKLYIYLFSNEAYWKSTEDINGWLVTSYIIFAVVSAVSFWSLRSFFIKKGRKNLFDY